MFLSLGRGIALRDAAVARALRSYYLLIIDSRGSFASSHIALWIRVAVVEEIWVMQLRKQMNQVVTPSQELRFCSTFVRVHIDAVTLLDGG